LRGIRLIHHAVAVSSSKPDHFRHSSTGPHSIASKKPSGLTITPTLQIQRVHRHHVHAVVRLRCILDEPLSTPRRRTFMHVVQRFTFLILMVSSSTKIPFPLYGSGFLHLLISAANWLTMCLSIPLSTISVGFVTSALTPSGTSNTTSCENPSFSRIRCPPRGEGSCEARYPTPTSRRVLVHPVETPSTMLFSMARTRPYCARNVRSGSASETTTRVLLGSVTRSIVQVGNRPKDNVPKGPSTRILSFGSIFSSLTVTP